MVNQHYIIQLDVSVREANDPQSLKGCCKLRNC